MLIHGLVRDAQGRKMSKSLGNGIDPIEMIDKYGADALRFSLIQSVAPGNDVRFSDEKVTAARNFANKVWNASRFALMNLDGPRGRHAAQGYCRQVDSHPPQRRDRDGDDASGAVRPCHGGAEAL